MIFSGWTVARAIPYEVWAGLLTGKYKVFGGVVRWAAGTQHAGEIVRHLIPATTSVLDIIPGLDFIPGILQSIQLDKIGKNINRLTDIANQNTYQLFQLSRQVSSLAQTTQQVLTLTTGTAILSGLGLAVSSIGFFVVNKKLNSIDEKLKVIQQDVKAIRLFLESAERARLYASLNALLKLDETIGAEHRHTILHTSKNALAEINMRYRELLAEADTIETAIAREEYFSLTAIAQARCTAELGMLTMAKKEIEEMYEFWKEHVRHITKKFLIGEYPERFLASDFAQDVPVSMIAEWLDFVGGEEKGLRWIDEMRSRISEPWYTSTPYIPIFSDLFEQKSGSGLNRNIGVGLQKERDVTIPALRKFTARNNVFEGYISQYQMLESQNMRPSELEQKLKELPTSSAVNGYFILEPERKAKQLAA